MESSTSSSFSLICMSSGSPPTEVSWAKNGLTLTANETYETIQVLKDAQLAVYDNILIVYSKPEEVLGNYTCSIDNSVSTVAEQTIAIEGTKRLLLLLLIIIML